MKEAQGICPFCHKEEIYYGDIDIDEKEARQEALCEVCGAEWYEYYKFNRIEVTYNPLPKEEPWSVMATLRAYWQSLRSLR